MEGIALSVPRGDVARELIPLSPFEEATARFPPALRA